MCARSAQGITFSQDVTARRSWRERRRRTAQLDGEGGGRVVLQLRGRAGEGALWRRGAPGYINRVEAHRACDSFQVQGYCCCTCVLEAAAAGTCRVWICFLFECLMVLSSSM